ncbi:hypothetical protein [Pseudoalteromonas sp. L1]|uniref:hypothetical protein n=1 Tax=Pseudoalteromonas sp. L1 TaxID=195716 RepID=UPI001F1DAB80|nr:hypothetical protein [Pseudoalteromonas sp. L1]
MEKETYYLIASFIGSLSALISVIAAISAFRFSLASKQSTEEKLKLDRAKYAPYFNVNLLDFKYNKTKKRYEGEIQITNSGEVTQTINRISIGGSAELVPKGAYIISTPELMASRSTIAPNDHYTFKFKIHTWDVRFKKANIEVIIGASNAYTSIDYMRLDCADITDEIEEFSEV